MGAMCRKNFTKRSIAALYIRLSREDGETGESASIENQRKILRNYANDNGFTVFDEYIDDGFTGTNFDRPAFKRLKEDISMGRIGVVLTKDFSRLGRNTGQVMTMLDDFFTKWGVRYISVTEGIDTTSSDIAGMLAPMLSFTNELYSADISKKINASFTAKMREGEFIGAFAPYGYKKDPKNKNHLLPDDESAKIVKRIFCLAKNGHSPRQIAIILNNDGVITPSQYRLKTKIYLNEENYKTENKWNMGIVSKILRNEFYLGHTVQGKTHKPSFKSKYIENIPKDEWIRVENTHKALIDVDTWNIVRKKMQSRTQVRTQGFFNLFSGIAKCSDCGRNMSTVGTHKKGCKYNLNCGGYKQFGPKACSSHSIDYDVLYNIVLASIRNRIKFTKEEKKLLIDEMLRRNTADMDKIDKAQKKLLNVSEKLTMLYDKKFSCEIDDTVFESLKSKYETEKENLEKNIFEEKKLHADITNTKEQNKWREEFKKIVENYENLNTLDSDIIFRLIERIDVHHGSYSGKVKHQKIDIYFKFFTEPCIIQISQ